MFHVVGHDRDVITHPAHFLPTQLIYKICLNCSLLDVELPAMNFADTYHERRRGRVFVDDPLSSLEQEILLFRHNNIQKFQQGYYSSVYYQSLYVKKKKKRFSDEKSNILCTYINKLTGLVVLGCVKEEPEYRLDDIECALRYNSLDSGIPPEYDEDEVANSINTTLNRSVLCTNDYHQCLFHTFYAAYGIEQYQENNNNRFGKIIILKNKILVGYSLFFWRRYHHRIYEIVITLSCFLWYHPFK